MRPLAISFRLWGDMDDSNSQTFASGYFSHSQIIKSLAFCEFARVNFKPCGLFFLLKSLKEVNFSTML